MHWDRYRFRDGRCARQALCAVALIATHDELSSLEPTELTGTWVALSVYFIIPPRMVAIDSQHVLHFGELDIFRPIAVQ